MAAEGIARTFQAPRVFVHYEERGIAHVFGPSDFIFSDYYLDATASDTYYTIHQEDNYGRKAVAYLPTLKITGMKVIS